MSLGDREKVVAAALALVQGIDKRYANGSLRVDSTDTFWDEVEDVRRALALVALPLPPGRNP